jgi:hypothetical protein
MQLVPHAIAPMLLGSKGEKRRVTGHRWEEPNRSPPIPRSPQKRFKTE